MKTQLLIIFSSLIITACNNDTISRGYSDEQITQGAAVFKANCQVCHGVAAKGLVKDWQKRDENGQFPAPPLDGSAHAWHHNLKVLRDTINRGGTPLGGTMPSFKDVLSEQDKTVVLAYILNLWPDKAYQIWEKNNG